MKIKSLLLGSAAALATTATSQAADAIVIEPEPMEYVSVCDMYGTGYFYIPGTDTCLKLGGYVQLDYYTKSYHEDEDISDHRVRSRARLQVAAKNETSYGTLNSQIWWYSQLYDSSDPHDQFSTPDGFDDDGVGVWLATMSLAGFRAGYDATNYTIWNTYGGKGFYTAVQEGGYTEASGFLFEYNGSFGDINYGIGVVDTTQSGAAGQPDVMAGFRTSFGILGLHASAAYDSNSEGVAYRLRGDLDLDKFLPGAAIGAWWEGDNGETDYRKGHQWGVTAKVNLIDKIQLYAGYSDYDYDCDLDSWENAAWGDEDNSPPYPGNSISTTGQCAAYNGMLGSDGEDANYGSDQWTVGVRWDVTPNLYTQLEYNKTQSVSWDSTDQVVEETDTGTTWLRIRRSF